MEIKTTEQKNAVMTVTKTNIEDDIFVEPCIFILFAEYMGFVSKFIEWAEECCNKPTIEKYKVDILRAESNSFLSKMKKDYNTIELHQWYEDFHKLAISKWQDKYNENHKSNSLILL